MRFAAGRPGTVTAFSALDGPLEGESQGPMHKRKLLIGLATAGALSAGFGPSVAPASAALRTLDVTLLGGRVVRVTLDVPPDTPLDELEIPGITVPVVSITEVPGPAPDPSAAGPASGTTAGAGASGPTGATSPSGPTGPTGRQAAAKDDARSRRAQEASRAARRRARAATARQKAAARRRRRLAEKAQEEAVARARRAGADAAPAPVTAGDAFALPGGTAVGVPNFFIERFRIPPFLLPIYQAAGIQYGVRWEVLAAINEIETDYGRNLNVSTAGALGWMQFMPATWEQYGVDANDDAKRDPYNPVDAIFASARYLKAAGAATDIRKAIFAYNHADWYVDSVLMRARLIGGLPAELVGSLTGLTQGHFPVHAVARYAEGLSAADAHRRVARGRNAAMPVESSARRTGIDIFAKAGSPVIAVQDATVTDIGTSKRLGRYVKIRDVYGNTYTYGGLKRLAVAYPVPKEKAVPRRQAEAAPELPKDPRPQAAASAGRQVASSRATRRVSARRVPVTATRRPEVAKERLFANPRLPAAFAHGGQEQLLNADGASTTFKSYFTEVYGLKRSEVTLKPLKRGSRLIAGTILGRIGRTSRTRSPHVRFEVRPAGAGAPRIDPKPILDGWKLLESTSVYRAGGEGSLLGADAHTPSIGQLLLMSKEALQRRVLADSRVDIYAGGRRDIAAGAIDRRVLATLEFLTASGLRPTISSLKSGHSFLTASGNVSEHSAGSAMDIAAINGIPIAGHQGAGSITDTTIRRLLTLQGTMKPHQIISLMTFDGADNTLSLPDHADHIHVGFRPDDVAGTKDPDAVLKPSQWLKLIGRLGTLENPTVLTRPSSAALPAKPARGSEAHAGE